MNERIKELRDALGITLEEFGSRLGVTRTAISRLERGNRGVTDQMAISICREFGVNETWLRTGEGEMFEQTRASVLDRLAIEYSLDKEQVSVIENFLDLSPQERTLFLACMRKVFGGPAAQPRAVGQARLETPSGVFPGGLQPPATGPPPVHPARPAACMQPAVRAGFALRLFRCLAAVRAPKNHLEGQLRGAQVSAQRQAFL